MPARRKDLNEATRDDLAQIPQMSSARAETIIHYRDQHGGFNSIEQLSEVPGIGETMAQQVAEYFSVRGSRSTTRSSGTREDDEGEAENTEEETGGVTEDTDDETGVAEEDEGEAGEEKPKTAEQPARRGGAARSSRK